MSFKALITWEHDYVSSKPNISLHPITFFILQGRPGKDGIPGYEVRMLDL